MSMSEQPKESGCKFSVWSFMVNSAKIDLRSNWQSPCLEAVHGQLGGEGTFKSRKKGDHLTLYKWGKAWMNTIFKNPPYTLCAELSLLTQPGSNRQIYWFPQIRIKQQITTHSTSLCPPLSALLAQSGVEISEHMHIFCWHEPSRHHDPLTSSSAVPTFALKFIVLSEMY